MKASRVFLVVLGLIALIWVGGCSKKPAPGPVVSPPEATTPAPSVTQKPATTPTTETEAPAPAVRLKLEDAFFEYDKYELRPEARQVLSQDAEFLMSNPGMKTLIEGHCDERGTNEYNLALGDRRARAAKDFLVKYGIDPSRIETISYGEERPFALGHDEAAWSQNRRAHFTDRK